MVLRGVSRDRFEEPALGLCLPQALLVWEYSNFFFFFWKRSAVGYVLQLFLPVCGLRACTKASALVQSLKWAVKQAGE